MIKPVTGIGGNRELDMVYMQRIYDRWFSCSTFDFKAEHPKSAYLWVSGFPFMYDTLVCLKNSEPRFMAKHFPFHGRLFGDSSLRARLPLHTCRIWQYLKGHLRNQTNPSAKCVQQDCRIIERTRHRITPFPHIFPALKSLYVGMWCLSSPSP